MACIRVVPPVLLVMRHLPRPVTMAVVMAVETVETVAAMVAMVAETAVVMAAATAVETAVV
ncbi:hypothetical protein, partial [Xanthomonas vasicola]